MPATLGSTGIGSGGVSRILGQGGRVQKIARATYTGPTSYATGGDDISNFLNQFRDLTSVVVAVVPTGATIANNRLVMVDKTAKKLIILTAVNTEATAASNQSAFAADLIAIGNA